MKSLLVAAIVVAMSFFASHHRFGDSAHAMGLLSLRGGKARHPVHLNASHNRCTLVVTATVLPPYRGDVEIELQGEPALSCNLAATEAVIDLGLRHHPRFAENCFEDVRPRDKLALWVAIDTGGIQTGGRYTLCFRDRASGQALLSIPVIFATDGEESHGR